MRQPNDYEQMTTISLDTYVRNADEIPNIKKSYLFVRSAVSVFGTNI